MACNGAYCENCDCEYNEEECYCEYEGSIKIDSDGYCYTFRYKEKEEVGDL